MDELVKLVVKKTGISEDAAEKAVKVVLDYLKKKLPGPIGDKLEDVLDGDGLTDMLGSLLK